MKNILNEIIEFKKAEIAKSKALVSAAALKQQPAYARQTYSLRDFLLDETKSGIIAEFKRRSPSRGLINGHADVAEVTKAYTNHGASCLSVLTDEPFFGAHASDLRKARENKIPVLRKDFIIDEYQVVESRAMGADVILLIASCLTPGQVKRLATFANENGLEVLLELHDETELEHVCDETMLVGINNRNLKTFEVDIDRSLLMAEKIPADKIKVAESGIDDVKMIRKFKDAGFKGFLIGEQFMKQPDPGKAFAQFVQQLKQG